MAGKKGKGDMGWSRGGTAAARRLYQQTPVQGPQVRVRACSLCWLARAGSTECMHHKWCRRLRLHGSLRLILTVSLRLVLTVSWHQCRRRGRTGRVVFQSPSAPAPLPTLHEREELRRGGGGGGGGGGGSCGWLHRGMRWRRPPARKQNSPPSPPLCLQTGMWHHCDVMQRGRRGPAGNNR